MDFCFWSLRSCLSPRRVLISSWISFMSCCFLSMPLIVSSYANFFIFCERARTSSMLTSASMSAFWISLTIPSMSFLSMKIAFDIFFIPDLRAEPSLSSTIVLGEECGLLNFGVRDRVGLVVCFYRRVRGLCILVRCRGIGLVFL